MPPSTRSKLKPPVKHPTKPPTKPPDNGTNQIRCCSFCKKSGHNRKTCPTLILKNQEVRAISAELNVLSESLPCPKESTPEDFSALDLDFSAIDVDSNNQSRCQYCNSSKALFSVDNGHLSCVHCFVKDCYRPPIKIPLQISPKSSIPLSVAFRSFTLSLTSGRWEIGHIWRGRYGSARSNLFGSDLAPNNDDSVKQLNALHPKESFNPSKPNNLSYWSVNPINEEEVTKAILRLPSGKAPGPSGISFDLLKSVVRQNSLIIADLVVFFNNLISLKIKPPQEFTASRLIALTKPNGKLRPIAVGESLYRLLSGIVFNRVGDKAKNYFTPFQYGIKTIDGASVAALTSDVFYHQNPNNCIFNLDFKNAFNSVTRSAIASELATKFPEVESFFYTFYNGTSELVFNDKNLLSSSGVKQGDPLGPFLFCTAIHPILLQLKQEFSDLEIVAYMDDISLIAPFDVLVQVANSVAVRYRAIGLELNVAKCLLISNTDVQLTINDTSVEVINYKNSSFRFLGCYLGLRDSILKDLDIYITTIEYELSLVLKLEIEKHLNKVTHLLRCLDPTLSYDFCRSFNKLRTNFLASLLEVDPLVLKNHIFCSPDLGGVGFTSSKYLTKAAFLGGAKNFVFEFSKRYANRLSLLSHTNSEYLTAVRNEISNLPPRIWAACFSSDLTDIPSRDISSLAGAYKKLQKSSGKIL
ncbi:hypothetical protein RCL1_001498 [Eukaryota sp. TZLM3-RCL]